MNSHIPLIKGKTIDTKLNYLLFFYIIFFNIISPVKLLLYFSSYSLSTGNVLLLSEEGLQLYEPHNDNITTILNISNNIGFEGGKTFLSFAIYSNMLDNEYLFCSIQNNFFLLMNEQLLCVNNFSDFDSNNQYKILVPFNASYNNITFVLGFIGNNNMILKLYSSISNDICDIKFISEKIINYQNITGINSKFYGKSISCELMYFKDIKNYYLTCFAEISNPYQLIAINFDINNNFEIMDYLLYPENNAGIEAIKSILSEDKKKSLVCYGLINFKTECTIYDSKNNEWGPIIKIYNSCYYRDYYIGLLFLQNTKEYAFYCYTSTHIINIFLFDENFNLKYSENKNGSYANNTFYMNQSLKIYSSSLIYLSNELKFILLYSFKNNSNDYFNTLELCFNRTSLFLCPNNKFFGVNETINISETFIDISDSIYNNINNNIIINTTNIEMKESIIDKEFKINFFYEENIMKTKINITKEKIVNNLEDIISQIDIGKSYKIDGKDREYEITISPTNEIKYLNSTYIDLGECVDILREKYNLSSDEIITILQIEIDVVNEKVLTNQIEYILFDEEKNKLDLSFCRGISISVIYKIRNNTFLDKEKINYFSDLNIDILNKDDPFFNDICYPYSDKKADLILKDRVNDIYQNFSICEDNCEYKHLNMESNSVNCSCEIKTEINIKKKMPVFYKIMENSFKDSNFEVIKCFKLIFYFSEKIHNAGFWVSIIILFIHIPLFIIYFVYKEKPIKKFVYSEMKKNNYLNDIEFPPKKIKFENNENNEDIEKNQIKEINDFNQIKDEEPKIKLEKKVRTRNKVKFDKNNIIKKRKAIKNGTSKPLRNSVNFRTFNQDKEHIRKTNKHLTKTLRNSTIRLSSLIKNHKKTKDKEKKDILIKNIILSPKNEEKSDVKLSPSSNRILKMKKNKKSVKFKTGNLKDIIFNKYNSPKNKISKDNSSSINIYKLRNSQRNPLISSSQIIKKLLGNEEKEKIPGFYNLIHINANNDSDNRPLDSKYILDNYIFETAILYDHRSFWRIYFICILSKESILNTFFFKSPLELPTIRYCLFLFNYSCDFALNAFFYLNQNISDRYHYKGKNLFFYSIINNLTISISSAIFSFLLYNLLSLLTNSKEEIVCLFRIEEKKMRKDKNYKVSKDVKNKIIVNLNKIFKVLKIKIIVFIISEISILLFFAYYMIVFCEIYKKTQMSWFSDSIVSFLISIPLELFSALLMACFYYISIRYDSKFIYNIVMFFYGLG